MTAHIDRPVVLIVLDGWGYRESTEGNAVRLAQTPTWDRLWAKAPRTLLDASGRAVGLPSGQMGNSEVGHMNLGAAPLAAQTALVSDATVRTAPDGGVVALLKQEYGGSGH